MPLKAEANCSLIFLGADITHFRARQCKLFLPNSNKAGLDGDFPPLSGTYPLAGQGDFPHSPDLLT